MPVVDCVSFSKLMSEDKFLGCLVGLAIGDALGAAVGKEQLNSKKTIH